MNKPGSIFSYLYNYRTVIIACLMLLVLVMIQVLLPDPVRHRFVFEIFRQVCLVSPLVLIAATVFYRKYLVNIDLEIKDFNLYQSLVFYVLAVILVMILCRTVFLYFPVEVEDEDEYLFTARLLASGRLYAPIPPCPQFFLASNFVMLNNKWYGIHPPGHPLILVLPLFLGKARLWAPMTWGLTVFLGYWLFALVFKSRYAVLGTLLLAFSPMYLVMSSTLLSENSSLLIFCGFLLCFFVSGNTRMPVLVTTIMMLLFSLGIITRPLSFLAVSAPFMVYYFYINRYRLPVMVSFFTTLIVGMTTILVVNKVITGSELVLPLSQYQGGDGLGFQRGFTISQGMVNLGKNIVTLVFWYSGTPIYFVLPVYLLVFMKKNRYDWLFTISLFCLAFNQLLYWHPGSLHTLPRRFFEGLIPVTYMGIRGLQGIIKNSGENRLILGSRKNLFNWMIVLMLIMNFTTFLPSRLTIFREFAQEAIKPLTAIPDALDNRSIILVSKNNWKFGYPRNDPDSYKNKKILFLKNMGPQLNYQLKKCFPRYKAYTLGMNPVTAQWTLTKLY